jgi:hypothetical protein
MTFLSKMAPSNRNDAEKSLYRSTLSVLANRKAKVKHSFSQNHRLARILEHESILVPIKTVNSS